MAISVCRGPEDRARTANSQAAQKGRLPQGWGREGGRSWRCARRLDHCLGFPGKDESRRPLGPHPALRYPVLGLQRPSRLSGCPGCKDTAVPEVPQERGPREGANCLVHLLFQICFDQAQTSQDHIFLRIMCPLVIALYKLTLFVNINTVCTYRFVWFTQGLLGILENKTAVCEEGPQLPPVREKRWALSALSS